MSKYVKVASVLFSTKTERDAADSKKIIVSETAETLKSLENYGLDLIVFSEGVEACIGMDGAEELSNPGPLLREYMSFAKREKCHIAGSAKIKENGNIYNSIVFIDDSGTPLGAYYKMNLTQGEIDKGHKSGKHAVVVDTKIGRLGGAICFDLNFQDVRDEYVKLKPDIIAFSSMYHGGLMQEFWAYQCRSFFISALQFIGGGILDPFGRPVALSDCYTPVPMATINLDRAMIHLDYNREKFPDIRKKYKNEVTIDIPPNIAPALIYSNTDKRTAADVVKEFGLELLDDYLARSTAANIKNRR
jgi:hypothetical protein